MLGQSSLTETWGSRTIIVEKFYHFNIWASKTFCKLFFEYLQVRSELVADFQLGQGLAEGVHTLARLYLGAGDGCGVRPGVPHPGQGSELIGGALDEAGAGAGVLVIEKSLLLGSPEINDRAFSYWYKL